MIEHPVSFHQRACPANYSDKPHRNAGPGSPARRADPFSGQASSTDCQGLTETAAPIAMASGWEDPVQGLAPECWPKECGEQGLVATTARAPRHGPLLGPQEWDPS